MKKFLVTINTTGYERKKFYGPDIILNDYMESINGLSITLDNMQEVIWQIEMFNNLPDDCPECWNEEGTHYNDVYLKWLNKPENKIVFIDTYSEKTVHYKITKADFFSNNFYVDEIIDYLEENDIVRIPFYNYPDIKAYNKHVVDNCYMEIKIVK